MKPILIIWAFVIAFFAANPAHSQTNFRTNKSNTRTRCHDPLPGSQHISSNANDLQLGPVITQNGATFAYYSRKLKCRTAESYHTHIHEPHFSPFSSRARHRLSGPAARNRTCTATTKVGRSQLNAAYPCHQCLPSHHTYRTYRPLTHTHSTTPASPAEHEVDFIPPEVLPLFQLSSLSPLGGTPLHFLKTPLHFLKTESNKSYATTTWHAVPTG